MVVLGGFHFISNLDSLSTGVFTSRFFNRRTNYSFLPRTKPMDQTSSEQLAPISQTDRILSLDVMRGIVLCGILLMNINGYGLALAYVDPTVSGGARSYRMEHLHLDHHEPVF